MKALNRFNEPHISMTTVIEEDFRDALLEAYREEEMSHDEASKIARDMLRHFDTNGRKYDNLLSPSQRTNFYTLEEEGLLTTSRTSRYKDKKPWTDFFWHLKFNRIKQLAISYRQNGHSEKDHGAVY